MIISPRYLARSKMENIHQGFSAFSENTEVTHLIERYIQEQNLNVLVEKTHLGCWFIPEEDSSSVHP